MAQEIPHNAIIESVSDLLRELAKERGRPVSIAVLDGHREMLHFTRMDGAPARSIVLSSNKAYTAVWWGRDTVEVEKVLEGGKDIAWYGDSRLTAIGGGVVIRDKNKAIVGAVGVSGRTMAEDMELATRLLGKIVSKSGI
jgi:uncharacterized protein GlcG (DUF336 family)